MKINCHCKIEWKTSRPPRNPINIHTNYCKEDVVYTNISAKRLIEVYLTVRISRKRDDFSCCNFIISKPFSQYVCELEVSRKCVHFSFGRKVRSTRFQRIDTGSGNILVRTIFLLIVSLTYSSSSSWGWPIWGSTRLWRVLVSCKLDREYREPGQSPHLQIDQLRACLYTDCRFKTKKGLLVLLSFSLQLYCFLLSLWHLPSYPIVLLLFESIPESGVWVAARAPQAFLHASRCF